MKKLTSLLAASLLLVASVATASAQTEGPITTSTPISSTLTDCTGSLAFAQFNPSLGTLISVQLDLNSTLNTSLTVTNSSGSASSGTANTELQITVQDYSHNLIVPEVDLYSPTYGYGLGAGDSVTSGLLSANGTNSELYTLGSILTEFTGSGTINLNASTFTQTLLANTGGNTSASQVTDDSLTGDVIYTYSTEAAPEPSSWALALIVVTVLGVLRVRTTRQSLV